MADQEQMPELDDETRDLFDKYLAQRQEADERKRARSKQPKDFGEYLDKVKDALKDAIRELTDEANQSEEDREQAPQRGSRNSIRSWWTGEEAS